VSICVHPWFPFFLTVSALDLAKQLTAKFGTCSPNRRVSRRNHHPACRRGTNRGSREFAKKELSFDYLVDISSLDNYGEDPRWTLVYHLRRLADSCELRLKTGVSRKIRIANRHRCVAHGELARARNLRHDGHPFRGHPDLRRIFDVEGYPYFPLRKDFPLAGNRPSSEVAFTQVAPLEGGRS